MALAIKEVTRLDDYLRNSEPVKEQEGIRLGDFLSLPRPEGNIESPSFFQATEKQINIWKKEGPIGYFNQSVRQDKTEMIPFNPEGAVKSVQLLRAVKRLQADDYKENPTSKALDVERVNNFLEKSEEERIRGFTVGGRITQGVAALPAFMVEFLITGGAASIGKQSIKKGAEKLAGEAAKRGIIRATTSLVKGITGAAIRTALMPHRVTQSFAERQVNASLELTEKGLTIAKETTEDPAMSFMKAIGDVMIENFTEEAGPALIKIGSKIIPKKLSNTMIGLWMKLHPNESVTKIFNAAGYNGFLAELGEERLAAILRALFDIEDFGAENSTSVLDRLVASIPNGEELLIEAGVLAFPGTLGMGVQQTTSLIRKRRAKAEGKKFDTATGEIEGEVEALSKAGLTEDVPEALVGVLAEIEPDATAEEIIQKLKEAKIKPKPKVVKKAKEPLTPTELARLDVLEAELGELEEGEKIEQRELERRFAKFGVLGGVKRITKLQRAVQAAREKFVTEPAQTKAEIKEIQNQLIKNLEESKLEAKDKAKFLRTIKNIQTPQQMNKVLPELAARIETLQAQAESRKTKSAIKKAIKVTRIRKQAGKPISRLTPEVQKAFDFMRNAIKLTQEQAKEQLLNNLSKAEVPTEEQAFQNRILGFVSGEQFTTPEELNRLLQDIETLKAGGKAKFELKALTIKEQRAKDRENAFNDIVGRKTPSTSRIEKFTDKFRRALSAPFKTMLGWDNLMNLLAIDSKVEPGQSELEKITSVKENETAEKKGIRIAIEGVLSQVAEAYGFTKESQVVRKFREDSKIQDLGIFKNERGEEANFEISRSEARKLWMELQDVSLRETLFNEKGNAYSPAMIQAVEEFLTQEDKDFAQRQLQFYRDFYKSVNEVYKDVYGVELPFNEFYSPISREFKAVDTTDEFLQEINFRRSVTSGSLKSRVENIKPIKLQSDITVLQKHIIEMEHFKNWVLKIRQLNNVFTDNKIKDLIDKKFDKDMRRVVNDFIQDFTRGGIDRSKNFGLWDKVRIGFTRSALAIKPSLAAKQMVSFIAFADDVPTVAFAKGIVDFALHPIKSTIILNQSEVLKARGQNLTRDIRDAMKSDEFSAFRKNPSFLNSLMFMVKMGDRGAILLGGWSVYKHALDKTGSAEKALKAFEDSTSAAQQSADLSQLSTWQRGNTFQKMFTMFTSSQNQYFRKEYMAIRNLIASKVSAKKAAKTILIYHFLLPMFFQWVSDFGKWNKEEQLRAAILGSFNGIFIIGDMLDSAIRQLIGLKTFEPGPAPLSISKGILKAIKELKEDDISSEDFIEALKNLSISTGQVTGIPFKTINDWLEGVEDIQKGQIGRGALKLLGWSPYVVEKNLGKISSRPKIGR